MIDYSVEDLMSRGKMTEVQAVNYINEIIYSAVQNGYKCVRIFSSGKLSCVKIGRAPRSKYEIKT